MMFFIQLIHYKVYLTDLKNSKLKWIVYGTYCINVFYCRLKGTEKNYTERFFKSLSNIYSI